MGKRVCAYLDGRYMASRGHTRGARQMTTTDVRHLTKTFARYQHSQEFVLLAYLYLSTSKDKEGCPCFAFADDCLLWHIFHPFD